MRLAPSAQSYFFWRNFAHTIYTSFLVSLGIVSTFLKHRQTAGLPLGEFGLIFGIILLVCGLVCYGYSSLLTNSYSYDLSPDGIALQKGVLNQTHEKMPYSKVQDVLVQSTILMRMFGLASVTVQNAATAGFSYNRYNAQNMGMVIPALEPAVAEQLRDDILKHVNQTHHTL